MARTFFIPGHGVVIEDGEEEYFVPGHGVLSEDNAAVTGDPAKDAILFTPGQHQPVIEPPFGVAY